MKRSMILFLFIFTYSISFSQIRIIKKVKTIISGVLMDKKIKKAYIQIHDEASLSLTTHDGFIQDSVSAMNGEFKYELYISHPVYLSVSPSYTSLTQRSFYTNGMLIEPGDSIHFFGEYTVHSMGFENIIFFGKGVEKLWCIQEIIKNMRLYDGTGGDLINKSDSITKMVLTTISIFQHKLSPIACKLIKAQYIPQLGPDISDIIIDLARKKKSAIHSSSVKALYKSKLAESNKIINISDPDLKYCYGWDKTIQQRILLLYIMSNLSQEYSDTQVSFKGAYYDYLYKGLPPGVREKILGKYLIHALDYFTFEKELIARIDNYLHQFDSANSIYKYLSAKFEKYKGRLVKGTPAYSFSLPDTTGKIYQLNDFKGKVLLLDFMFHPCIGCAAMVPYLKKIEDSFKNAPNIKFISITIDKNSKWKEFEKVQRVKYYVPGSLLLHTNDEGHDHPIIKFYDIQGYPKLVLIDKEGNIITNNAPDPRLDDGKALTALLEDAVKAK